MREPRLIATLAAVALTVGWSAWAQTPEPSRGFGGSTADGRFSLQLSAALQGRYTYVAYDDRVVGNEDDYSNFYLRRARVWFSGHAYDPRLTYVLHVQLEPSNDVSLLDGWVQYRLSDWLAIGAGRSKIAYGLEFLTSGFGLNFVERSVMYGETDIDKGGGGSTFPGGGTAPFGTSIENANTGFPTGGLHLYRSQGVQLSGRGRLGTPTVEYQFGVWQGRDTRGGSNADDRHLVALRVGYYPVGFIDWSVGGDVANTQELRIGAVFSAYRSPSRHNRSAAGTAVPEYRADDMGWNVAAMLRFRGLSADLEWATERYEVDASAPGDWSWDRQAWRTSLGYFVVPGRIEVVARVASIQRLVDATEQTALDSGLGLASVRVGGEVVKAIERRITELTAGVNFLLDGHRHKLAADVSRLTRSFVVTGTGRADDQVDWRFRTMYQLRI